MGGGGQGLNDTNPCCVGNSVGNSVWYAVGGNATLACRTTFLFLFQIIFLGVCVCFLSLGMIYFGSEDVGISDVLNLK